MQQVSAQRLHASDANADVDRLRAIAILFVLAVHIPGWLLSNIPKWKYPWGDTWSGVEFFFVVSGFVITRSLVPGFDAALQAGDIRRFSEAFFIRRIFRLLPAAWFWILVVILCSLITGGRAPFSLGLELLVEALSILFYVHNFYYAEAGGRLAWHWSLSIEEQFYLLYPLFLFLLRSRPKRIFGAISIIVFISAIWRPIGAVNCWDMNERHIRALSQFKFDYMLGGCLLGMLSLHQTVHERLRPRWLERSRWMIWLFNAALILALALVPAVLSAQPEVGYPALLIVCMLMVWLSSFNANLILPSPLLSPILDWFGKHSYSLYLVHIPSFWLARLVESWGLVLGGHLGLTILAAMLACSFAAFTYRFIENPMRQWGRVLAERRRHPSTTGEETSTPATFTG